MNISDDKAELLTFLKAAVTEAIEPLARKIEVLTKVIDKLQNQQKSKLTNTSSAQSLLNPAYIATAAYQHKTNNWGLNGQGRTNSQSNTAPKLYSQVAAPKNQFQRPNMATLQMGANYSTVSQGPPKVTKVSQPSQLIENPAYELAKRVQGFHPISSIDIKNAEKHLRMKKTKTKNSKRLENTAYNSLCKWK